VIDEGLIRGLIALTSLATFIGICWWAYRPQSRERFERDALLVFEEGDRPTGFGKLEPGKRGEGREGRGAGA
jgi:cbb3-type cytochrome oxidase subunit 3